MLYALFKIFYPSYGIEKLRNYFGVTDIKLHTEKFYGSRYKILYKDCLPCDFNIQDFIKVFTSGRYELEQVIINSNNIISMKHRGGDIDIICDFIRDRKPNIYVNFVRYISGALAVHYYFDKTYSEDNGLTEQDLILKQIVRYENLIDLFPSMHLIGCDTRKALKSSYQLSREHNNSSHILDTYSIDEAIDVIQSKIDDILK